MLVLLLTFFLIIYLGHVGRLSLLALYFGMLKTPSRRRVLNFLLVLVDIALCLLLGIVMNKNLMPKVAKYIKEVGFLRTFFASPFLPHGLAAKAVAEAISDRYLLSGALLGLLVLPAALCHGVVRSYVERLPLAELGIEGDGAKKGQVAGFLSRFEGEEAFLSLVRKDLVTFFRYRAKDKFSTLVTVVAVNFWIIALIAAFKNAPFQLPSWLTPHVFAAVATVFLARGAGFLLAGFLAFDREGKAVITLFSYPISPALILRSRLTLWGMGSVIFSLLLGGAVSLFLTPGVGTFFLSTGVSLVVTITLASLWLAAGLFFPNFAWENFVDVPSGRASLFAGMIEFVYCGVVAALWLLWAWVMQGKALALLLGGVSTIVVSVVLFLFFYREALWKLRKLEI